MAEYSSGSCSVGVLSACNESLVECCSCRRPMSDPVLLTCLHSCCASCLKIESSADAGEQTLSSSLFVKCPACYCEETELSAVMPNVLLCNYKRLSAFASDEMYCKTCDDLGVAAVFWCADCCISMCNGCYSWHSRFHPYHRSAEVEVARTWSMSQLTPAAQCVTHKRQLKDQCFTCSGPKCLLCYESCSARKHDLKPLSHDETKKHLSAVIKTMRSGMAQLRHKISCLQQKCQDARRRLQEAGRSGDKMLVRNKKLLHESTVQAFDTTVGQVCTNLQRIWCTCTTGYGERITFCKTADLTIPNIEMLSVERLEWLELVRNGHLLKMFINLFISEIDLSLKLREKYWQENGSFSIDGSAPLTSDTVLLSCIGTTDRRLVALSSPLLFGQVSVSFRTPVALWDLAITRDGRVLLAALFHGLLVYSDRGQQLSSWRPARRSNGRDGICTVAVLSDGRVAVCLALAQLVVLLRSSETGDTWIEDRRVAVLQTPPSRLTVHGDLLAASVCRRNEQSPLGWVADRQVKVLRISSGRLLYTHSRDYDIGSIALTALCLVTATIRPVLRNSGATPSVVDAFSHSGEFLWRYETSDEELVPYICFSVENWSSMYMIVTKRDMSSSKVVEIGGANGRNQRDVLSSRAHGLQFPMLLSLTRGEQKTVMAVASVELAVGQLRSVSLYEATSESRATGSTSCD